MQNRRGLDGNEYPYIIGLVRVALPKAIRSDETQTAACMALSNELDVVYIDTNKRDAGSQVK